MTPEEKKLSNEESLQLITSMINKVKTSYHDRGTGCLLWGSAVSIAAFVTYVQVQFSIDIGFDIWLIVLAAIIPQIVISIKENREKKFKSHDDVALDAVWITYAITIFGLVAYNNIIPYATEALNKQDGWVMTKHYLDAARKDEVIHPFVLSSTSVFILIYAFPTLITGVIKKFTPMIAGAVITYLLFIASCFTAFKYDMLLSGFAAIVCWLIPGFILRYRYRKQKEQHV